MPVRSIPGGRALSDHARASLNTRLRPCGEIEVLTARFHHFLDISDSLTTDEEARLAQLLNYAPEYSDAETTGVSVWVTPRLGTISPWSSKATEIIRACGLKNILRVERGVEYRLNTSTTPSDQVLALLHDRMTQSVLDAPEQAAQLFEHSEPAPLEYIRLGNDPMEALRQANTDFGLALSPADMEYLVQAYSELGRDPTDAELMMFAQVNSEHCRHKIFNAHWTIDGQPMQNSLFSMIRNTHKMSPEGVLSAYSDNAAVLKGGSRQHLRVDPEDYLWKTQEGRYGLVIKVETHNHPTGISPFSGAATGSGGEIRDETACGRGGRPKAGLCGFAVSNLDLEDGVLPWEKVSRPHPARMATPLEIMIEGPVGAASFNNEFGRPCVSGFFRTLEVSFWHNGRLKTYGYHKPIMLAGGIGSIDEAHIHKQSIPEGTPIVVLGGPAMLIGLGGGAASSQHTGASAEDLDYASVQRSNPEMQRRAQEVIEQCVSRGEDNPILSIHDVGAGGLSNAIPELVRGTSGGAVLELRDIPCAESRMSPREIWCNEAQERYVIALRKESLDEFAEMCRRERSPFAVVGHATDDGRLQLGDARFGEPPVDVPMPLLFGGSSQISLEVASHRLRESRGARMDIELDHKMTLLYTMLEKAVSRVLTMPSVASKSFLITIGDRSVGGLTVQDQMVGPWQVPVADAAIMLADFEGYEGEAMAVGERLSLAPYNPAASARMAIAECLSNLAGVRIRDRSKICLSANWMAAGSDAVSLYDLYEAVEAVGMQLCPELGIPIPVGKDSLSMHVSWDDQEVMAPVSLVVSAFAPVDDVRVHATPQLHYGDTTLLLICLNSHKRLGGSAFAQACGLSNIDFPDVDDPQKLAAFFDLMQELLDDKLILAYHDRSDGGLLACLCECAFTAPCTIDFHLPATDYDEILKCLFNEEVGAIVQVELDSVAEVIRRVEEAGLVCEGTGDTLEEDEYKQTLCIYDGNSNALGEWRLDDLYSFWGRVSCVIAGHRDHVECARCEYDGAIMNQEKGDSSTGVQWNPNFGPDAVGAPNINVGSGPMIAILREQGVNGHVEMAAAFARVGFNCRDLHMSELRENPHLLREMSGFAACGGFSYGDVLGAGGGWAKNILYNNEIRESFEEFFARPEVFALGVCNGCQMMSQLKEIIPGAEHWPRFVRNLSEQFESRMCQIEILPSPSVLLRSMEGSSLPIVVAHGEGRIDPACDIKQLEETSCMRYVSRVSSEGDHAVADTWNYPQNPNGSKGGVTALTNADGRFTIMMPHPERVFRLIQNRLDPRMWGVPGQDSSPWIKLFENARRWLD